MQLSYTRLLRYLPLLASALALVAILLPPIARPSPVHRYLMIFDISQSMNVRDVQHQGKTISRLAKSKAAATALLQALPCGSKLGLGVFAATRTVTLITPLEVCEHYDGLLGSLNTIDDRMRFKNASSIGKGLHQSLRAANVIGDHTAVLMFSDGHEAPPLADGQTGMPKSEGLDIEGFMIGVGGDIPVSIPKVDNNGRDLGFWLADEVTQIPHHATGAANSHEELSSLRETHISQLADLSGLDYLRLDSLDVLTDTLQKAPFAPTQMAPVDLRWIPAGLALLLLSIRFLPITAARANVL